jgi:ornithine cyclodeaminase/alanine dehydrogenase-like protein (mu-crystallin family)
MVVEEHGDPGGVMDLIYLSRADVEGLGMTMREVLDVLDEGFAAKGRGLTEMPPKPGVHPRPDCFIHAMPAWVKPAVSPGYAEAAGPAAGVPAGEPAPRLGTVAPRIGRVTPRSGEVAGVKWVSGYPPNKGLGIPYISGLVVLNDCETGFPVAVMDCAWITAMRTGASVGIAARHLARKDGDTAAIVGCGVQARTSLRALVEELPALVEVRCYDIDRAANDAFIAEMGALFPALRFVTCPSASAAVRPADVAVTAIPIVQDPAPELDAGVLKPGALAVALDYDADWTGAAMRECDRFFSDDVEQLLATKAHGVYFGGIPDEVSGDLGEVAAGLKPGRTGEKERIFCMNMGIAVDDVVTARVLYERAVERGAGVRLPL